MNVRLATLEKLIQSKQLYSLSEIQKVLFLCNTLYKVLTLGHMRLLPS